eukprot:m.100585 g.100585  ORF g.100585 m.100585 type:complete len:287 (+) comp13175_c0_seq11:1952-2812(+)
MDIASEQDGEAAKVGEGTAEGKPESGGDPAEAAPSAGAQAASGADAGTGEEDDEDDASRNAAMAQLIVKKRTLEAKLQFLQSRVMSSKVKKLVEHLSDMMSQYVDDKVIVFCNWTVMLSFIGQALAKYKISHEIYHGAMTRQDREEALDNFCKTDSRVLLCTIKSTSYGINLTHANHVVIFDPWWNPAVEAQAVDRCHRIGQTKSVSVLRFICPGTIEERITEVQNHKLELAKHILSGGVRSQLTTHNTHQIQFRLNKLEQLPIMTKAPFDGNIFYQLVCLQCYSQ